RGPSLAGLVGDIAEPQAVPSTQVRHHFLPAGLVVDHEILERFDLDDDQVLPRRGAEVAPTSPERRASSEPGTRGIDLRCGCRRAQPGGAQVIPRIVRVIAERTELLDGRAIPKHLLDA